MSAARFARLVLVCNLAVILWGAVVRATGSGAGCGAHWPLCNGEIVPRAASVETLIEFSHRATSGIALLLVVALVVVVFRTRPKGDPTRLGAVLSMSFMLAEAAVGAGLVLFELVAQNASMARAMFMVVHLGNTFFLLASLGLTAYWAAGGQPVRLRGRREACLLIVASVVAILLAGSSGAVAALGDTLFPASSLAEALRQDLAPSSHLLIRLRMLHPLLAVVAAIVLYGAAMRLPRLAADPAQAAGWSRNVQVLVGLQIACGVVNLALLAPVWLQLLHLLLADLLWLSFVVLAAHALALPPAERRAADVDAAA